MKYQINNGIIDHLPPNAVVAMGAGDYESEIDLGDEFYRYDLVDGVFVISRPPNGWHDDECSIQIRLTHIDNAKMLQKYPQMASYGGVLPCYIENDYVYLYANYITEEDIIRLTEFNAEINEKN